MSKYTVIKKFTDLQDNNYKYYAGDLYPRDGLEVSASRIKELSTDQNRRKTPLISAVVEQVVPEEITPQVEEQVSKEAAPLPKEEPQKTKTGENSPKATRAKRSTKKS